MLSEDNTYISLNKDPLNKLTADVRALLLRWKKEKFIDTNIYRKLLITDGILPRAYGLMKIHKENYLLRIIVSSINNPSYPLAAYLHSIILKKRWEYISCNIKIPLNEFIIAISLIINSTFFKFNNKFYRQIFGTPMGFPLSPMLADIVLQDIEEAALCRIPAELPFYIRYIDDILLAAPDDLLELTLEIFNSFHVSYYGGYLSLLWRSANATGSTFWTSP